MRPVTSPPLDRARRFARPAPDLYHTSSLTDDDLRACWEFRRGFMDLKPHVSPQDDYKKYSTWVRGADFAWLPRDPDGRLRSTFFYKVELRRHQGRPAVLLWPEYGYSRPDARGSAGLALAMLAAFGRGIALAPGAPVYLVGSGYLSSYTSLCQGLEHVFLSEDPAMTPWERSLYRTLAAETAGYDADRGLVEMATVPRNPRTEPPRNPQLVEPWKRYVAHNPRWTDGYTCFVFGRCPMTTIGATARWLVSKARSLR